MSKKTMDREMLEACASDYERLERENERLREGLMKAECSELRRVPYRSEGDYTCRNECQHSRKNGDYCQRVLDTVNKGGKQ